MNNYSFIFDAKYGNYFRVFQKTMNEYSFIYGKLTKKLLKGP